MMLEEGSGHAIVLVEPQIPPNTGTIGRLCQATGSKLHLVRPLGFSTQDSALKRAGMDYWKDLEVEEWDNLRSFWEAHPLCRSHLFCSTRATNTLWEQDLRGPTTLYFGREDAGLPEELLRTHPNQTLRIPMKEGTRSLNLALSVAIVLYEALRQNRFSPL